MNFYLKPLLFSVVLISNICFSQSSIAPKYSNEFLQIGVGADALGMSNAVVAKTNNSMSGYWNPSGLTGIDNMWDVSAMHSEYFAGIAKYDFIGLARKIDEKSTVGFSAIRFAVDDIPNTTQLIDNGGNIDYDRISTFTAADYAFLFSYARKLKIEGLSVGGNFKVVYRKVGDFANAWGFGLDGGIQYKRNEHWKFGLMARDVTSTFNAWIFNIDQQTQQVFVNTGNEIPKNGLEITLPRFIFGAHTRYNLGQKGIFVGGELDLSLTTDGRRNTLIQTNAISVDPAIGVEVGFKNFVALRFGIGNVQYVKDFTDKKSMTLQPNIGIGLGIKNFFIDYAFTDLGDQSIALYSHVISLRVKFNQKTNTSKSKV